MGILSNWRENRKAEALREHERKEQYDKAYDSALKKARAQAIHRKALTDARSRAKREASEIGLNRVQKFQKNVRGFQEGVRGFQSSAKGFGNPMLLDNSKKKKNDLLSW